ncbi:chromosomal replication initiator DnaA [Gluconacetobacter azotocaptans]|uniref:Chromosomal replication initiator DnaA n=1 Tax=Gluconacetobacter azotocaptans TaxID=142834 RepID=A0A7W4JS26_9PROT|nr:chromosomal replication initiator DnaA [Gluconacetobacter azotocaptans]MBB2189817.1 chromosomal replication initiator DnaA [Gluconacetobacter azotocaptans]MBM9402177.1 chromosomal replication initiator DnaA [Gluconacetobacter azotocaptans]GBQ37598.1 chromosome replication initiator DnaA [Gluconacetobacter azotocaptans DSM 13594]
MVEWTAQNKHESDGPAPSGQLVLPFAHARRFTRADFVAAPSNGTARAWLLGETGWPEHRLALWGAAGTGKTHLLEIWAHERGAVLLAGRDVCEATVGRLFGGDIQPPVRAVAVDDADRYADRRAMLHLLNGAREHAVPVALAARLSPARWGVELPDLASRLRATMAVEVRQPEDSLLRILLLRHLAERQIVVSQPVTDWLLRRLPRTASSVREAAIRLDHAGLVSGRGVTRAIAMTVLRDMLAHDAGPGVTVAD